MPFWGILVYFVYAMRRVNCPHCGITVEQVPWAQGKRPITNTYGWFLARWAKRMSWSEVASAFRTSWHIVFSAVEMAVTWGRGSYVLLGVARACNAGSSELPWYQIKVQTLLWGQRDVAEAIGICMQRYVESVSESDC